MLLSDPVVFLAAVGWLAAFAALIAWLRAWRELRKRRRAAAGALGALRALDFRDYDRALALAEHYLPGDAAARDVDAAAADTVVGATSKGSGAPGSGLEAAFYRDAGVKEDRRRSVLGEVASTEEVSAAFRRTVMLLEAQDREGQIARRELEDVLSSLQDSVLVVDDEARLRFLNAAAQSFFHVHAEDVLGAQILEALPSFGLDSIVRAALRDGEHHSREVALYAPGAGVDDLSAGARFDARAGSTGNGASALDVLERADGSGRDGRFENRFEPRREVLLRVAPVRRSDGVVSGAVAIVQDLTELRRLERVRRDFVANASHELRTPIANIRAAAETVLDAADDPSTVQRFLPRLVDEAERLSRLVSDLLDLARADSSNEIARARVDLARIACDVAARLAEKAQQHGIEIVCGCDVPVWVMGDGSSLDQVAFNLLDNALMYTPAGGRVEIVITPPDARNVRAPNAQIPAGPAATGPTVNSPTVNGHADGHRARATDLTAGAAQHAAEGAALNAGGTVGTPSATPAAAPVLTRDALMAVLRVSDTGIGIPSADLPRIFERFYRVDKARSRSQGGTGLGLAIVKHIVERHGGHIRVESEGGQGTTFHVLLPVE
jgi:signal transduction histidine kinase